MSFQLCKGSLPWASLSDKKKIYDLQVHVRNGVNLLELLGGLPMEFLSIMRLVDKLGFYDTPNYNEIYGLLRNAVLTERAEVSIKCFSLSSNFQEFPYDWEPKKVPSVKKATSSGKGRAKDSEHLKLSTESLKPTKASERMTKPATQGSKKVSVARPSTKEVRPSPKAKQSIKAAVSEVRMKPKESSRLPLKK
jgi:hypothetical protein